MSVKKICCIGAGYVGGSTMPVIASHCPDIQVVVVDINVERIRAWNTDELPIFEPGLLPLVKATRDRNLSFSTEVETHIRDSDIIFITVNTGTKTFGVGADEAYDLTSWELVTRTIAKAATESRRYILVEKSTVPVSTAMKVKDIVETCAVNSEASFQVLSNPEFLAEGTAVNDLQVPDRVLIGCEDSDEGRACAAELSGVYTHWVPAERVLTTNLFSAELAKLASNTMLAQRLSTVNALAVLSEAAGANVEEVTHVVGADTRLGSKYLKSSVGWGGSCFKKDVSALVYLCENFQLRDVAAYFRSVVEMNEYQKQRFCRRILHQMFGTIRGKRIAVLGFAFKKDTGDTRESAAIDIVRFLLQEEAKVVVYDPEVDAEEIRGLCKGATVVESARVAAKHAHAVVLCTEWDAFKTLNFEAIYADMMKPAYVFDGRNILDQHRLREIGFRAFRIGERAPNESMLPY